MERPSNDGYCNWADFSHREIVEGRARGNRRSLWLRARIQTFLFKLGHFAQIRSASVVMIGLVFLVVGALGLYKAKLETNVETLWMEVGGRLEKELAYSKEYGSDYISYEVIIQTPNVQGTNILTVPALQKHVEVVKKAMEVEVEVFSQTWTIQDLCTKPSLPGFGNFIDKKLEQLIPCTVVSPLECFWDGAKIYTENVTLWPGLKPIQWTSFNPSEFLNLLSEKLDHPQFFDKDKMDSMFREGGISYGYLNKPCLDPRENGCPSLAPNRGSRKKPDIGLELTGGCKGFAEKLMIWPEDLIVGGVQRNKSGVIKSAEALQTIINLQSDENLYNYWRETDGYVRAKIQHIEDWNVEKARTVLHTWQRKFVKVVNNLSKKSSKQNVMAFSTTSFNDLLKTFSEPNKGLIAGGYVLMLVYACFTMIRWNSMVQSQGCMGVVGVLLVSLSVAAGLGVSSFFGISFNAASTQVLPFLALGLGVDDMFLLAHTFRDLNSRNLQSKEQAGYCLSITGVSIMLTSFTNATAFFVAAIIPIPALRALCLKAGIIIIFNFLAIVIIYPAMIAMDVRRRESQRYDIFCCVQKDSHTRITQIRPDTTSYDNSMVTINNTSDEDSSLHQISTASANVSIGQSSTDAFTLPGGVALIASANCNFNSESICNGIFGGDIMALPGMGNIVISVSSAGNTGDETSQNANANVSANISNNAKGSTLDIGASSSTSSTRHGVSSKVNRGCTTAGASENLHSKKENNMMGSSQSWCDDIEDNERNKNNTSSKRGHAKSSVRFSQNLNTDTRNNPSKNNGSKFGNFHVSANAVADTTNGEPSCSSNAEVILRPDQASSSREQRNSSWQNNFSNDMFKTFARFSLGHLTKTYYAPLLQKKPVKILVLFLFAILLSVTIFGCFQVKDGIDMTDMVPKGTKTSDFLEARNNYFSFYDIVIVTKSDFNYANGQDKLYRLHKAFAKVDAIVKSDDGELPKFWLIYLREWLQGLQQAFDADWERGTITLEGPYSNASSDGKLAYKLLLHTGSDGQVEQVQREKLVEKEIIHRRGFYNFLRAWRNMDPLSYEISQVQIKPDIDFWGSDKDRRIIFPAKQIKYARMPFYLNNLKDTADYVKTIKQVREICDRFNDEGLPNYPRGVPFTFWEQYIWLRKQLLVTIIIVLVASFLVISAVLVNVWAGSIVVVVLAMTSVELFGFLGLVGIKLSAIPAVTLIFSIGVGVEFSVHLCMVFVTSLGDRNQRLQQALETVLSPVVDGAISTMLGIIMLAGSEFDFVVKYFFHVLAALIVIGFLNGVVFLPVVLSLVGPNPEVVPLRAFSTSASTRSWLGLMPLDRHRCSSVSNLTVEQQPPGAQESSTETDDVHLQIMPTIEDYPSDSKTRKWKKGSFPRHFYGKNLPSTTENSKQVVCNPSERSQTGSVVRNTSSVAKLTATATVTVELQQNDHPASQKSNAIVTRSSVPESDLTLVDVEEFV